MREIIIIRVYFLHPGYFFISCTPVEIAPFDRFSCFMAHKMCFRDSYVFLGCKQTNFNNFQFSLYFAKNAKLPIPAMLNSNR